MPNAYQLPIIYHEIDQSTINQRAVDGYINATEMCKAAIKQYSDYARLRATDGFLEELSLETGIPRSSLVQTFRGTPSHLQGTWVHPYVAVHLAQWLSPKFAVQVSKWVYDWVGGRGNLPDHVRRYVINQHKIPHTHFSMLNQMYLRLLAPLEIRGYILPNKLMPDIALGKMFSKWCREQGYDPDSFPIYPHEFLDHRPVVPARLYPNELMTEFNSQLNDWLKDGRAENYFNKRDSKAIASLHKVLELPAPNEDSH